ncbi:MAG: hypothetical protein ACJ731_01385 [Vicinamibacterales bacterium]
MDLSRALGQLTDIHQQLAKGEIYRGYRSVPVAASGIIGLVAAWAQAPALGQVDPVGFVEYWAAIASCAALIGTSEIIYNYVRDQRAERTRTRHVVGQFLPSLAAGAIISASFVRLSTTLVPLLPGLWALCFGIGIFASRPYLPRASGWVGLFYYAAGVALLWMAHGTTPLHAWWVGGTFGLGQLLAAFVLFWNLERPSVVSDFMARHGRARRSGAGRWGPASEGVGRRGGDAPRSEIEENDGWEEEV